MPSYDYRCNTCGFQQEYIHSIKLSPEYLCPECNQAMERLISHNTTGFIFKGGTEAMNWKEKRVRMKRRNDLGVRQIDRYGGGPKLRPNVAGHETETWSDASKLAKEAGMDTSSYTTHIEKEKSVSKVSGIDDKVWKKAKDDTK
jgi:putative FmdB family regulatory protein